MEHNKNKKLTRFEVLMGVALIAAVGLALMPSVLGILFEEPGQRAVTVAEELAHSLADFHRENAEWPTQSATGLDLAALARKGPATAGSSPTGVMGTPVDAPLVREIPLDPWGRPYRAILLNGGAALTVFSSGPDGIFDTAIERLWGRRDMALAFDGDDAGFILVINDDGGRR
jgi:hypothetical protein